MLDIYWGSGSPYAWRVLLALEIKQIPYTSHLIEFSKNQHKEPAFLAENLSRRFRTGDEIEVYVGCLDAPSQVKPT